MIDSYIKIPFWPLQQTTKAYKRHSSIIPSSHLLTEAQEMISSPTGNDFEPCKYDYTINI